MTLEPQCWLSPSHGRIVADRRLGRDDAPDDVNWVTRAADGSIRSPDDLAMPMMASTIPNAAAPRPAPPDDIYDVGDRLRQLGPGRLQLAREEGGALRSYGGVSSLSR